MSNQQTIQKHEQDADTSARVQAFAGLARSSMNEERFCHPKLHLLAVERTGWRRWVFGRWVYSSEPFRRDIQRANKHTQTLLCPWERICDPDD